MVNNLNPRIVAAGACRLRQQAGSGGRVKIDNGPVYDLSIVQQLVPQNGIVVMNDKADADMVREFNPDLTPAELIQIICKLRNDPNYLESERCTVRNNMTVDSDEYRIFWNRNRNAECNRTGQPVLLKFGFRESNPKCIIVSIHRARY